MNGYDIDGTLTAGIVPKEPYVVISGRTWKEWDSSVSWHVPVAIRGVGVYGDPNDAADFKIKMINLWQVTDYYEDDIYQAALISNACPNCTVHLVNT